MKIVQMNTVCQRGSVGRILLDLYQLQETNGHTAFAVYGRESAPNQIKSFKMTSKSSFYAHVIGTFLTGRHGFMSNHATKRCIQYLDQIKPDLIHLHNLHGFYLNMSLLFEYLEKEQIPIVYTLHDCWSFTGHCAFFDYIDCKKWKTQCEHCPIHRTNYPYALLKDASRVNYNQKAIAYKRNLKLTMVTPSKWLADKLSDSILKQYPVKVIHNGIDLVAFHPQKANLTIVKETMEKRGIDFQKKRELGVANVWEQRKGLAYFVNLAKRLDDSYQVVLVGVSSKQKKFLAKEGSLRSLVPMERTQSLDELAFLYARSTVFLNPTLEDNFPTTNLEALACGTPVITFDTGGSKESLIKDSVPILCGRVIPQKDADALFLAVKELAEQSQEDLEVMRIACRNQAQKFDKKDCYQNYIELYEELIK